MIIRKKTYDALIAMAAAVDKRTTETIEAKENTIKAKQRVIDELEERIKDLEGRIKYHRDQAIKSKSAKRQTKPKQKTWHGKTEYKPSTTTQNDGAEQHED